MEKTLQILEQYVQWIVLGLALLFFGFMAYTYLLGTPVTVKVGRQEMAPGDVDPYVQKSIADRLRKGMNSTAKIEVAPINAVAEFRGKMNPAVAVATITPGRGDPPPGPTQPTQPGSTEPRLAAAKFAGESHGRSVVALVDPKAKADPRNPGAAMPVIQRDVDHDSTAWTISIDALNKAFDAANIDKDPVFHKTQVIKVDLFRQEQLPSGEWTKEQYIPPLRPQNLPPFPAVNATKEQRIAYLTALHDPLALTELLRPAFFDTIVGKGAWTAPDAPAPAVDPNNPAGGAPPPVRPAVDVAPTLPPAGGAARGAEGGAPAAAPRPAVAPAAVRPPAAGAAAGGAAPPADVQLQPNVPAAVTLAGPESESGLFDPATVQQDLTVIAHDTTVKAGHTYRYKVRYTIYNPLWEGIWSGAKAPPAVKVKFALVAPDSEWSKPVTIEPRVKFWLVNATKSPRPEGRFDVFIDSPNGKRHELLPAGPGDAIGDSGWMVVDVRDDGRGHSFVLVADANGRVVRREKGTDEKDPDYDKWKADTAGATAAR